VQAMFTAVIRDEGALGRPVRADTLHPIHATLRAALNGKVSSLPLGAVTVSKDTVFTTLFYGTLIALNRATGAIVYRKALPTTTNPPLAVFGNKVLVPAGGPQTSATGGAGDPQLVAYTVSS
ncbi:MAG: hypothetical protein WA510_23630, partial [Acidobacteriaceae bacterium]